MGYVLNIILILCYLNWKWGKTISENSDKGDHKWKNNKHSIKILEDWTEFGSNKIFHRCTTYGHMKE